MNSKMLRAGGGILLKALKGEGLASVLWVVSSGWWSVWRVLPGRASVGVFPFQDRAMKLRARL